MSAVGYGQQDPQFTQYNYNTMTVNPGYTGSRGHLAILSLYRSQWMGIEGSPQTITFGIDSPIGISDGVGISIIQDVKTFWGLHKKPISMATTHTS